MTCPRQEDDGAGTRSTSRSAVCPIPSARFESFAHPQQRDACAISSISSASNTNLSRRARPTTPGLVRCPAFAACWETFGAIMDIMLPTMYGEQRKTPSPVLPINEKSDVVLQSSVIHRGRRGRTAIAPCSRTRARRIDPYIFSGKAKLQWKVDWAMRWVRARRRLRDEAART